MHLYSELYLETAREKLAMMYYYAVHDCHRNPVKFTDQFMISGYAKMFERGNPYVHSEISGVELAMAVMEKTETPPDVFPEQSIIENWMECPEYWAGWMLADYQWHSSYRFRDILKKIGIAEIISMFDIYHSSHKEKFHDAMDSRMKQNLGMTNLQRIRKAAGLSRAELAERSEVNSGSISSCESRRSTIDQMYAKSLFKMAVVLGCSMEDLLEDPTH